MSEEEQWAFWSTMNQDVISRLIDNDSRYEARYRMLDEKLDLVLERTAAFGFALDQQRSHLQQASAENVEMPTSVLSLGTICWLHRVITEGDNLPEEARGHLRKINIWIGQPGSTPVTATFVPVPAEEVASRTQLLLAKWCEHHSRLKSAPRLEIITALAEFYYGFLEIHPFLDANGRLAKLLLDQASRELLNQSITAEFTKEPSLYYSVLREANSGNLGPLVTLISAALK
jgi:Fic family protein